MDAVPPFMRHDGLLRKHAFVLVTSTTEKKIKHINILKIIWNALAKREGERVSAKKRSMRIKKSKVSLPSSLCYAMQLGESIIYPSGFLYVYARIRKKLNHKKTKKKRGGKIF